MSQKSRKYNIEFFQSMADNVGGGTDISSAYEKGATVKNLISSSGVGSTGDSGGSGASAAPVNSTPEAAPVESSPQGIQMGNIWQFLGIDTLTLKKKQCVYNCGMDLMGCMERCANPDCRQQQNLSHEQCRYGCMRKGISCSTNCISEIEPIPEPDPMFNSMNNMNVSPTTSPFSTQPVQVTTSILVQEDEEENIDELCLKHYDILPNEVKGVYADLDDYAPFDMRVWPKDGKFGWTLSELNRLKRNGYDSPDTIEVNMNHGLYPIKKGPPVLEFNYVNE
jgi:hypothetical protein